MTNEEIFKRLKGDFRKVAEVIGVQAALKLAKAFGGFTLTIPSLSFVFREDRDRSIREEYDRGVRVKDLARKHKIGTRQLYNILGRKP